MRYPALLLTAVAAVAAHCIRRSVLQHAAPVEELADPLVVHEGPVTIVALERQQETLRVTMEGEFTITDLSEEGAGRSTGRGRAVVELAAGDRAREVLAEWLGAALPVNAELQVGPGVLWVRLADEYGRVMASHTPAG